MSNAVNTFNGLNGKVVSRQEIVTIIELAKNQEQTEVIDRLQKVLDNYDYESLEIEINRPAVECVPASLLPFIDIAPELPDESKGLGKAVSPNDIYQFITDTMVNTIKKVGNLPWQKEWEKTSLAAGDEATNYESKKGYRGINFFLLNFEIKYDKNGDPYLTIKKWENPFFLTFKQIYKFGGKLKKGSTAHRVVYFTKLYTHSQEVDGKKLEYGTYDQKKFRAWIVDNQYKLAILKQKGWDIDRLANSYIPILKYYNVFNAASITGIKWGKIPKNENAAKPENEKLEVAEAIIKAYPNPPKIILAGDQPMYQPKTDTVVQTKIENFKSPQSYYSTFFHELTHSTGHSKRLNRGNDTRARGGGTADKKAYAFEELVAEMGAVFLSAESGILFETRDNSAKYLKGWNSRLVRSMEEDNRFFFRAASASQAAADHILDRDKEGNPAYLKKMKVDTSKEKVDTKTDKTVFLSKEILNMKKHPSPEKLFESIMKSGENEFSRMEFADKFAQISWIKEFGKTPPASKKDADWQSAINNGLDVFDLLNDKKKAKKPKSKSELEKANPKGFAKKPKSVAVTTAIKDVLSLPKYKGKINEHQAAILYKHFKDDPNAYAYVELTSDYERGIMKKDGEFFEFFEWNDQIELTDSGEEFVQAVNARRESLLNQKNNLALFEGLKGVDFNKNIIASAKKGYSNQDIFVLGHPGGELKNHLPAHQITLSGKVLKKAMAQTKDHNINWGNIIDLPKNLNNPQAIFKSKTKGYVVLTYVKDVNNKPVMVAVHIEKDRKSLNIASIYSRRSFDSYKKWIDEGLLLFVDKKSKLFSYAQATIAVGESNLRDNKDTKKSNTTKKGLKSPAPIEPQKEQIIPLQPEQLPPAQQDRGGQVAPEAPVSPKVRNIATKQKTTLKSEFYTVNGEVGKFLQAVERKPKESVMITLDGEQGAGKTTTLYKFMDAFAAAGNRSIFFSLEEHPDSSLAIEKEQEHLSPQAQLYIDTVGEVESQEELYSLLSGYDIIFMDSWQKLVRMIGNIRLDEDLRKKFDGKVFVIIFQQTTTGRTKGGAEVVFDGDIVIKMVKEATFSQNFAYFDKHRYTKIPLENLRYNVASGKVYDPNAPEPEETETIPGFCITEV